MRKIFALLIFSFLFIFQPFSVSAEPIALDPGGERILDYQVLIEIKKESFLEVEERIVYDFGKHEKHGIFRDIPYRYERLGLDYDLEIYGLKVFAPDGSERKTEITRKNGILTLRIGDPEKLVSGRQEYIIKYQASWALNFFDAYDELYWNAIGPDWEVPIEQSKVTVKLPQAAPLETAKMECFSGPFGSSANCVSRRFEYDADGQVLGAVFVDDYLSPGSGLTLVLGFGKQIVKEPGLGTRSFFYLKNNMVFGLPLLVLALMSYLWYRFGRDPAGQGVIIAEYEAPDNLSPAEIGTMIDEQVHKKDISAEIINLAVNGYLKIEKTEKGMLFKKDDYIVAKLKEPDAQLASHQRWLMERLFKEEYVARFKTSRAQTGDHPGSEPGTRIRLSDLNEKFYSDMQVIMAAVYKAVKEKGYFAYNPRKVRIFYLSVSLLVSAAVYFLGSIFFSNLFLPVLVSAGIAVLFSFIMPVKTKKGAVLKDRILGFKDYLSVAEADRIKFHNPPQKTPERFEKFLPYAMVLGVEKEWAGQFEGIYRQNPGWYSDPGVSSFSNLNLLSSVSMFSAQATNALSHVPSSAGSGSSGFSGGGVGGGFSGGGGGSW